MIDKPDEPKSLNGHGAHTDSSDDTTDRDPLEALAAEFADRYRQGERVSVEQYAAHHPELADEIRDLFPTIVAMERLNTKRLVDTSVLSSSAPLQLGDYRIIGEIARGGMGIVYEAEQVTLGRRVAVKVLPQHALRREHDIKRFEREAHTAAKLHHSNIVPVFGVGEDNGSRYIVMQLIRGVGLDEILSEIKRVAVEGNEKDETTVATSRRSTVKRSAAGLLESKLRPNSTVTDANVDTQVVPQHDEASGRTRSGGLAPVRIRTSIGPEYYKNVARVGLQVAEALHYAHRHDTLHRDVKPGNLLLDEDGRVWVADFGLAKAVQDDNVTCSGDIVGTMAYVAPERFRGTTTKASDIYSLGITLHEMLTFQKAFDGNDRVAVMNQVTNERLPSPRQLNQAVPRDLETIVLKAASHDPMDRYSSAGDLASDLEAYLDDLPIQARPLSRLDHAVRWCRRNRAVSVLAASVVLLLATVFGLTAFGYVQTNRQRQQAEATSKLAIGVIDEIYALFAATPLSISLADDEASEETLEDEGERQIPISKDVALLLDRLLGFYDKLSQQTEDSDTVTIKYIAANRRVGDINRQLGRLDEARLSYEDAVKRISRLNSTLRDTETMRLESARVHNGLGLALSYGKNSGDRVEAHRQAVGLLDHDSATVNEQFELATSLYLLHVAERRRSWGRSRRDRDEPVAVHLQRASDILNTLKRQQPNNSKHDLLLARCLLADQPRSGVGGENQKKAIAILESLVKQAPSNPDYQFELGQVFQSIERHNKWNHKGRDRDPDELAQSEKRLRRALEVTANLETRHPNIPRYYLLKKELHEFLAGVLRDQGELPESKEEYVKAIQMQKLLMSRAEKPQWHEPWLYRLELAYGKVLRDAGDARPAKDLLMATAAGLQELIARNESQPDRNRFHRHQGRDNKRILTCTYVTLANVLDNLGETEESQEALRKAEELGP